MKKAMGLTCSFILTSTLLLPNLANASAPKQILFSGGSLHKPGIYKMNEDTTAVTRITDGVSVDASPDGKKLAFIKNDSLYISDIDGKHQVRLTKSRFPVYDSSPRWSPDGKKIVFSRSDGNIYSIDKNGKNLTNLTNTDETVINSEPDWSPDGSKIVFHSNRNGNSHIFVMNADGSSVKQLTGNKQSSEYSAHFSPDGRKILYGRSIKADSDIYIMNADGKNPRNLTKDIQEAAASPLWSDDGKKIVFTLNEPRITDHGYLLIMNADGSGKATIKLPINFVNPYDWNQLETTQSASKQSSGIKATINYLSDFLFD
ncbi:TolB family protein [Paenactinomyces guangxiensis]|uniref:PD40 domain-containing protein n=1 Tax=Paenactinomyces guangxiensis TaxID=1490290 RepID=A0A7W2A7K3_9BACL|nr:DPP IV N-terminal domain-containing protein [Paenactinomyces guangxiensis]MBA4494656.1 PD40 domain-containing protein [Paenactinomyces guangxiensis]MBH8591740.1 PD40 domain-containing protein [Paenactinomyces guangxiensis]